MIMGVGSKPLTFWQGSQKALMCAISGAAAFTIIAVFARAEAAEKLLYSFACGADGALPVAPLVIDSKGALYGTTKGGGDSFGDGTVFQLTPPVPPATKWTHTVIHTFTPGGDGFTPVAGLIFDSKGVLYGTTSGGGKFSGGTVFKLKPPVPPATTWTEKILYSFFAFSGDLAGPSAGVVFDSKGALYGTAAGGSAKFLGGVFKLKPPVPPATTWTEKILYTFKGTPDGAQPTAAVVLDSTGALYGTTGTGGFTGSSCCCSPASGCGIAFKLTPPVPPATNWTETVLHRFKGFPRDGQLPASGLVFGSDGALYSTTVNGGAGNGGTAFKLTPPALTETVIHSFLNGGGHEDGGVVAAGLIFGSDGALYGTNSQGGGGPLGSHGVAFKLTPPLWGETVLHDFTSTTTDGGNPEAGLIFNSKGALFGTTAFGGASNCGTVFKLH